MPPSKYSTRGRPDSLVLTRSFTRRTASGSVEGGVLLREAIGHALDGLRQLLWNHLALDGGMPAAPLPPSTIRPSQPPRACLSRPAPQAAPWAAWNFGQPPRARVVGRRFRSTRGRFHGRFTLLVGNCWPWRREPKVFILGLPC